LLLTGSGTSWTATEAPLPPDAAGDTDNVILNSVSCPSATACTVGGYFANAHFFEGFLLTGSGTSWTASQDADPVEQVGPVDCVSAAACTAIGSTPSSGATYATIITGSGTSWTDTQPPLPAGAPAFNGDVISALACPSTAVCTAVGNYDYFYGPGLGQLLTGSGTSWGVIEAPLPANADATSPGVTVDTVACPSTTACVAAGTYRDSASDTLALLLTGSGSSWTATQAPMPSDASVNLQLTNLSAACPATSTCVVTGSYQDSSFDEHGVLLTGPA